MALPNRKYSVVSRRKDMAAEPLVGGRLGALDVGEVVAPSGVSGQVDGDAARAASQAKDWSWASKL